MNFIIFDKFNFSDVCSVADRICNNDTIIFYFFVYYI